MQNIVLQIMSCCFHWSELCYVTFSRNDSLIHHAHTTVKVWQLVDNDLHPNSLLDQVIGNLHIGQHASSLYI